LAGTHLDSLESLFAEMGRELFYHVELKDAEPELPARTLSLIDRFDLRDRVVVTSFRFEQVERMRRLAPELRTYLLIDPVKRRDGSIGDWIDRAAAAGMTQVGVASQELTRDHVAKARSQGLLIRAWRIKRLDDMEHAIAVGSDGMTIDWPEQLIARFLEQA
jgi:glycerophosphoryl diester phosphodiesterase